MIAWILGGLFKLFPGVLGQVLGHLEAKANSETERLRITTIYQQNMAGISANVVTTGMKYKMFWVAWSLAAVPLSLWFAWGVLDSAVYNGTVLPDVAALPPQLKAYADIVWSNIFYSGALGLGAESISRAIATRGKS